LPRRDRPESFFKRNCEIIHCVIIHKRKVNRNITINGKEIMEMENRNILLIDDDRDFVLSTKTFLEGRGYKVDTAHNGAEGWRKIKADKPGLVVLDIMMDYDAEGFNLAYTLRQDDNLRKIPIIIVSGFERHLSEKIKEFEFVLGQDWPADAYLEKPVNLKELAKSIEKFLPGTVGKIAVGQTNG
jgi:DNA-binding response OmpR family regulator